MLRELKTFLAVIEYGTFAAAGQRIGLTQSAVSAQIRGLEESLAVQLFDRSGRTAILSAAGKRVVPMAQEMLALYEQMVHPDDSQAYRGPVKIGAIATAQIGLLPHTLLKLQQEAPALEPKLIPGVSFHLVTQVEAGHLDLAVMIKPSFALNKELYSETLLKEPFVLVVPANMEGHDPLKLLRQSPFIRYDRTSFGGNLVGQFLRTQHIEPDQVLELDEIDAIVRMVEMGLGIALLPMAGFWLEHPPRVRVIPLGALTFYREIMVVMRTAQRQSLLHQLLLRCLHESAQMIEEQHEFLLPAHSYMAGSGAE